MNKKELHIGNKTAKLPLIQGGMGVGVSLSGLAGAVAREGGIGIISTAQIGFMEPDFAEDSKKANLRAMVQELNKARKIAQNADGSCDGLIGYNIMVATRKSGSGDDHIRACLCCGAHIVAVIPGGYHNIVTDQTVAAPPFLQPISIVWNTVLCCDSPQPIRARIQR